MSLPFLPTIEGFADKTKELLDSFFAPSPDKVRIRDVAREIPAVLGEIGQNIARNIGSAGVTLSKPFTGVEEISPESFPEFFKPVAQKIFTSEPIKSIEDRIADAELFIKDFSKDIRETHPIFSKLLEKSALPVGFVGVMGSVGLDFTPFGGLEKNAVKSMVRAKTFNEAMSVLLKMRVSDDIARNFAEDVVKVSDETAAKSLLIKIAESSKKATGGREIVPDSLNFARGNGFAEGTEETFRVSRLQRGASGLDGITAPKTSKAVEPVEFSDELLEELNKRFGAGVTKMLQSTGNEALGHAALVRGGEDIIANELGISRTEMAAQKIIDVYSDISKLQRETEKARSLEKSKRVGGAAEALEEGEGKEAFIAAKGELKGELPRGEAKVPKLTEEDVMILTEHIRTTPALTTFERIRAFEGLGKILGDPFYNGHIPQRGEMEILKKIFGEGFVRKLATNLEDKNFLSFLTKQNVIDAANIPRALMASMDMSAPLRQGLFLGVERPKEFAEAFIEMFKYFKDPHYFDAAMDQIAHAPLADLRSAARLELTDVTGSTVKLSNKEEQFMSNLAAKIPGLGVLVRASERAFAGFLNKMRADVFDNIAEEYLAGGLTPEKNFAEFRGLARFINTATGRGEFKGNILKESAPLLNAVFFAPRFMASRLQMLNPAFYLSLPPRARKLAVKSFLKFVSAGIGLLSLAKMSGFADVEADPRSSDFGKIRIGRLRYDTWGGFQQWVVLAARLITGESKAASTGNIRELTGDVFGGTTRLDTVNRFFQGKLAPIPALAADILRGKTLVGEELSAETTLLNKVMPLWMQDLDDVIREEGVASVVGVGIPAFFGVGTQVFDEPDPLQLPRLPELPGLPKLPKLPELSKIK